MINKNTQITVCICTYKRPIYLLRLLTTLNYQLTDGLFSYSITVVDNDCLCSAKDIVNYFMTKSNIRINYWVEPNQNISLARNMCIEKTKGEFLAFIDDDEFPADNWLLILFKAIKKYHSDGVLGPVIPHYEKSPPYWVTAGAFHKRPSHATGTILNWKNTRTGNVLLRKKIFDDTNNNFLPELGRGGEDRDFFKRMIQKGYFFIWCEEAPVYESVPPDRCKRSFMLKRALIRGANPHFKSIDVVKSFVAAPIYALSLPVLAIIGHHLFMAILIKCFDHCGRIFASININVIKQRYIL
jgi:glycosyltransferase involved in cell wall biosynthesis